MQFGESELTYIRHARQNDQEIPAPILNAPELELGLQIYLQAFFDLQADRISGLSMGNIPSSAVRCYARDMDFDADQSDLLVRYVQKMDAAYIKFRTPSDG